MTYTLKVISGSGKVILNESFSFHKQKCFASNLWNLNGLGGTPDQEFHY